ncbi:hypothetical protein RFI_39713 [Reticulomyxa filosa]|uniref:Copine C-terminal domain-containing protein n=1 Tax=Reticulomyxa filosa TaxID=46433 RepID=X6LAR5_RETFI|nr:hypothetical protein RFI_39713 [Reticulomyxa filosa]|eukprot:ETN97814.1 hypothetical protein RFI_39713 [Reticulomyxa filosa]
MAWACVLFVNTRPKFEVMLSKTLLCMNVYLIKCDHLWYRKACAHGFPRKTGSIFGNLQWIDTAKISLSTSPKHIVITSQKLCNADSERPLIQSFLHYFFFFILKLFFNKIYMYVHVPRFKLFFSALCNTLHNLILLMKRLCVCISKKKYGTGTQVTEFKSTIAHSFLDFLACGVDTSLHYLSPQGSQYQQAIRTIGNIVSYYDSDQNFTLWDLWKKSHDFALNGNEWNQEVHCIYGIEQVYNLAIKQVKLYGQTLFQLILSNAIAIAIASAAHSNVKNKIQYFTLLILADEAINDFKETNDLIVFVANKYLPLLIIIVGVGLANFTQIEAFDADSRSVKNPQGEVVKRDIVQFALLRDYSKPLKDDNGHVIEFTDTSFAELSKETLKKIQ